MYKFESAVKSLCGSTPLTIPDGSCQFTWTSVPLTQIGSSTFRHSGTLSYEIPAVIPSDAKEVLVYANFQHGTSGPSDRISHFKIFTEDGVHDYAKYITLHAYGQNAWNTNSDNLWFPMPSNRRVNLNVPNVLNGNIYGTLYVIGYR